MFNEAELIINVAVWAVIACLAVVTIIVAKKGV